MDTVGAGNGKDKIILAGTGNVVTAGNGDDVVTGGAGNATITLGNGDDDVRTSGLNNEITVGSGHSTVVAGTGNDSVTANGGHDTLTFAGTSDQARLLGATKATIFDQGTGLQIAIGSSQQTDTIIGFGKDGNGVVDLLNGVGGFTSVQGILAALHSDHHGGTELSLGDHGSIDFVDTSRSELTAANFALLAQFVAAAPSLSSAGAGSALMTDPVASTQSPTLAQPHAV